MPDDSTEARVYRRRENALLLGLILWAVGLSVLLAVRPEWVADQITDVHPARPAGVILFTVGILGGISDGILYLYGRCRYPARRDAFEGGFDG